MLRGFTRVKFNYTCLFHIHNYEYFVCGSIGLKKSTRYYANIIEDHIQIGLAVF